MPCVTGISYFYIGFMAVTKAITVGDFSMCVSAAGTLYWSLYGIVSGVQTVSQKCAYAHRYIEFLRFPAAMVKGTKPVKPGEHTIEFPPCELQISTLRKTRSAAI